VQSQVYAADEALKVLLREGTQITRALVAASGDISFSVLPSAGPKYCLTVEHCPRSRRGHKPRTCETFDAAVVHLRRPGAVRGHQRGPFFAYFLPADRPGRPTAGA